MCIEKLVFTVYLMVYLGNSVYTELFAVFSRVHHTTFNVDTSCCPCVDSNEPSEYRFNIAAKASNEFVSGVRETVQLLSRAATTGWMRACLVGLCRSDHREKKSGVPGGQSIYSTQPITGPSPAYSGLEVLQKHRL